MSLQLAPGRVGPNLRGPHPGAWLPGPSVRIADVFALPTVWRSGSAPAPAEAAPLCRSLVSCRT